MLARRVRARLARKTAGVLASRVLGDNEQIDCRASRPRRRHSSGRSVASAAGEYRASQSICLSHNAREFQPMPQVPRASDLGR